MNYNVIITEILSKTVTIDADNESEAIKKAEKLYRSDEVELDYQNLNDVTFDIENDEQED